MTVYRKILPKWLVISEIKVVIPYFLKKMKSKRFCELHSRQIKIIL